ncbi:hypothetical protein GFD17_02705 [Bifidobacterium sp. SMB2]|uniref:Uncharacterized protein n=1 Tax=Bifidobacterium saimiriisciurei TaxID=2661627 RepID=A0ABX0C7K1_9BIFI|nr:MULTISPECIES: hypothetical protein [Bifidobacterium]NEG95680.1 hypothetical protein [Bifidobacterium sp. SMB2]NEH11107.1 hypothetical protein [Bifidobacterium saimiriisciurei]
MSKNSNNAIQQDSWIEQPDGEFDVVLDDASHIEGPYHLYANSHAPRPLAVNDYLFHAVKAQERWMRGRLGQAKQGRDNGAERNALRRLADQIKWVIPVRLNVRNAEVAVGKRAYIFQFDYVLTGEGLGAPRVRSADGPSDDDPANDYARRIRESSEKLVNSVMTTPMKKMDVTHTLDDTRTRPLIKFGRVNLDVEMALDDDSIGELYIRDDLDTLPKRQKFTKEEWRAIREWIAADEAQRQQGIALAKELALKGEI